MGDTMEESDHLLSLKQMEEPGIRQPQVCLQIKEVVYLIWRRGFPTPRVVKNIQGSQALDTVSCNLKGKNTKVVGHPSEVGCKGKLSPA